MPDKIATQRPRANTVTAVIPAMRLGKSFTQMQRRVEIYAGSLCDLLEDIGTLQRDGRIAAEDAERLIGRIYATARSGIALGEFRS